MQLEFPPGLFFALLIVVPSLWGRRAMIVGCVLVGLVLGVTFPLWVMFLFTDFTLVWLVAAVLAGLALSSASDKLLANALSRTPIPGGAEAKQYFSPPARSRRDWSAVTIVSGMGLRFWAFLSDVGIMALLWRIIYSVMGGDAPPEEASEAGLLSTALKFAVELTALVLYGAVLESSPLQATLGKLFLKIEVSDVDGKRMDFTQALIRNFVKAVTVISLGLGALILPFTPRKQMLHDLASESLVVHNA